MNKPVILLMFLIGCLCLGLSAIYMIKTLTGPDGFGMAGSSSSAAGDPNHPGVAYADIPWKHLQSVPQFMLTDQNGDEFDSAVVAGKPYAISFFFATCPSICRDLNKRIEDLNSELKNEDITFISITVDAETDTPEVLGRYAEDFGAEPGRWFMLTGQKYKIEELGKQVFRVDLSKETHTEDIILVDKWGRWRDRFKWDDPYDMKRFVQVVEDLASETEPPLDDVIHTRNVLAGVVPYNVGDVPFMHEFHLTRSDGEPFFSRSLTGEVWIANFFFTTCPGICKQQNEYLSSLAGRLEDHPAKIVSITTRPVSDTTTVLEEFSRNLGADPEQWIFCTGEDLTIRRTMSEYFGAHGSEDHHSSLLFVVDRWGNVRGNFDWQKPEQEVAMLRLIDQLNEEPVPPATYELINNR